MTYGAESWTIIEPLNQQLRRTQRRMVRTIIGTPQRRTSATSSVHAIPTTGNSVNDDLDGNASDDSCDHDASSDPPTPSYPPRT
eukprot:8265009-Pyramimonas_sp.AAC.1